jgi:hypothetical protein
MSQSCDMVASFWLVGSTMAAKIWDDNIVRLRKCTHVAREDFAGSSEAMELGHY